MPSTEPIFFTSPKELRAWLEVNHETADELLVGCHRKETGRPTLTWDQIVDEALCFGWIDGVVRRIDDTRFTRRLTPRRRGSNWSVKNVARVADLTAEDRMRPAGVRAFEARTPERTGVYSYERAAARLSPEADARLRADAPAWEFFSRQPPSYRRTAIHWVTSAKREETRARRLDQLIADSRAGLRIEPLRRP
ncbi:MAG TPA: YdeI/OmpD-associated family protein [Solirubrobacteraceae bacterium]|nr:YdeI/OmpD-associated family protein [Solirubrobacteraceae bacterium]